MKNTIVYSVCVFVGSIHLKTQLMQPSAKATHPSFSAHIQRKNTSRERHFLESAAQFKLQVYIEAGVCVCMITTHRLLERK